MNKEALLYKLEVCYDPRGYYYGEITELAIECSDDTKELAPGFSYVCVNHKEIVLSKKPRNGHCNPNEPMIPLKEEASIREKYQKLRMLPNADQKELKKEQQKELHEIAVHHKEIREQERAKNNGKTIKITLEYYNLFLQAALEHFRSEQKQKEAIKIFNQHIDIQLPNINILKKIYPSEQFNYKD